MKVIKLPPILPGDIDLQAINQQLQDRTAQLDWSAVTSAPETAMVILLDGLDQSDDAEILGFEGAITDHVVTAISTYFEQRPVQAKSSQAKATSAEGVKPEVWEQAEGDTEQEDIVGSDEDEAAYEVTENEGDSPEANAKRGEYRVLKTATDFEIRQELEERILKDLLGPVGGEYEEIDEGRVSDRYLVGLVAPLHRRKRQDAATTATDSAQDLTGRPGTVDEGPEQMDSLPIAGDDTTEDGSAEAANAVSESMFPASLGMTFASVGTPNPFESPPGGDNMSEIAATTLLPTPVMPKPSGSAFLFGLSPSRLS
jgi:hypothetical protein